MKKVKSFLGTGWSFPPAFVRDLNTVLLTSEEENIRQCLTVLLSTQCGERLMNEQYGTVLRTLVFDGSDGLLHSSIRETITNAILLYEPRIKLADINIETDPADAARVLVNIQYVVRTNNSRRNFVFPFHVLEGTNLIQSP
jgi:phage baseplate assembly protein W